MMYKKTDPDLISNEIMSDKYSSIRLKNQLCFPLYACAKELVRLYRKQLRKLGLTYTQYIVMMVFWEYGGMTEKELGEIIKLDSGTLAPLLKRLEKQGLVTRTRPAYSENKLYIALTEQGEMLKETALNVPEEMSGCIRLSGEELASLKNLLDKMIVMME